jgi:hypothetical protein
MLNAVAQTLSQLGIGALSPGAVPPATSSQAASTGNDKESAASGSGQNVAEALHNFMHSLFQTLGASGGGATQAPAGSDSDGDKDGNSPSPLAASGAKGYGDLANRLQNLIQSLSGSASSGASAGGATGSASSLNSAFESLKQALQGNADNGAANAASLQTFLKTLAQNIQGSGSSTLVGAGNVVNTSA